MIPRRYGGGDVIVWDRNFGLDVDDNACCSKGELHLELNGEKIKGRVILIRTDRRRQEQWLVLHKATTAVGWDPRIIRVGPRAHERRVKADPDRGGRERRRRRAARRPSTRRPPPSSRTRSAPRRGAAGA